METKPYSLQAPEAIAKEYGGNKRAIAQAAQQGLLDPTAAVLAGMFIDRMRSAVSQEQAPTQTVAQEVLAQPQMPAQAMPQDMQAAPQEAGLAALPVDEQMFNEDSFAGGGIVAFSAGNQVRTDPYRSYIPGRGAYRLSEEDEERLRRAGVMRGDFQKPTFGEALGQIRAGVIDPVVDYFSQDPIRQALAGDATPSAVDMVPTPNPTPAGAPMTIADLNAMQGNIDRNLRLMPGLTPEQSVTNVAAARQAPEATAAAAPAGFNVQDIIARSGRMARGLIPEETAPVPTIEQAGQEVSARLKQSGFDEELLKKQREELEKEKGTLAEDKKTAVNMRLIEAGLGIMAGESANAFTNIGKGATPALQGLSKDIKELKTAERAYNQAQRDLDRKQNDFALGKDGMTQKVIDKAQQRVDERAKEIRDLQGGLAKTMLAGEIQRDLAKATYGKMTDFDKQWARYEADAKRRGEEPSFDGFQRAVAGVRGQLTYKDAVDAASKSLVGATPAEIDAYARQLLAGQQRYAVGATSAQYQEGQTGKDKSGRPIVFRNGQWVYP
jgi:hypothetical protein